MQTQKRLAETIIRRLHLAGHEALLAGGCVRDELLGRTPKDYDVATSATPDEVLELYPEALTIGAAFGVVIVVESRRRVEVATFRAEAGYADGRHPDEVRFTDAREDTRRRDFTINGMFMDPETNEIIDYVGGREDLDAGRIRAIGDPRERFDEDRLRMLRAVRFAAELGFDIERRTAEAVRELADGIRTISGERIRDELEKLLKARPFSRRRGLELMAELGLMAAILPEVDALRGVEQGPIGHPEGDVFVHTLLVVEALREPTFELALAALLHDVGKPAKKKWRDDRLTFYRHQDLGEEMARDVGDRLRLSGFQRRRVAWLVRHHMLLMHAAEMREAKLKRLFAEPGFEQLAELYRADCIGSGGTAEPYERVMERYREMGEEEVAPEPLITGHDLIEMGMAPGPAFSDILETVYDAQLEGRVTTREEARDLARNLRDER